MKTSLQSLPQKKVTVGFAKLQQAGVSSRMWLAMLNAPEAAMQRLVTAWPCQPRVYDAVALLGFGGEATEPLPDAAPGTLVIRYGGWSLRELRDKRNDLMHKQDWYDKYPWAGEKLPSGLYVLRLPIPDSNRKTFAEQTKLLLPGEEPAHVVLATTALLSHRLVTGEDLLKGGWTRCGQRTDDGGRVGLRWDGGRLHVRSGWDDHRSGFVWLSSARAASCEP
jgi:hypothetical protein